MHRGDTKTVTPATSTVSGATIDIVWMPTGGAGEGGRRMVVPGTTITTILPPTIAGRIPVGSTAIP